MKRAVKLSSSLALLALVSFSGCGGSTSSSTDGTGYYVDSNISGVEYVCGRHKDTTDADGKFTFEIGKGCTFSVGNLVLRNVSKDDLSDKLTIFENNTTVARLLQTMDNDGDASNGISITADMLKAFKENNVSNMADIDSISNNIIDNVEGYSGHLVTELDANNHLQNTIKGMLKGKAFYGVTEPTSMFLSTPVTTNDTGYIIPFKFNDSVTKLNEGTDAETPIDFNGTILTFPQDTNASYMLFETKTGKYLKFKMIFATGSNSYGYMRLYNSKNDAQAYIDTFSSGTTGGIKGGTTGGTTGQQLHDLINSVNAQTGLDGYTVRISDPKNISVIFKEDYFVFTPGNKVKYVSNKDNGDQFIYNGTYEVKTVLGFGNEIEVNYKDGDTDTSNTIFLDDTYHVKSKQLDTFPTAVYSNDNNGLVLQNNTPATGSNVLTITSPDDVKGYTITSNEAHISYVTQTVTIQFGCDGTFTQTITTSGTTDTTTGDNIRVDGNELLYGGDGIDLDSNHQIVGGKTCFMNGGSGTGEACSNNLYVKTITQHDICK